MSKILEYFPLVCVGTFLGFLCCKLFHVVDWSYVTICIPLFVLAGYLFLMLIILGIVIVIVNLVSDDEESDNE